MSLTAEIKKNLGGFTLDVDISSSAKRIGILGASGSGKSMTLRGIAGLEIVNHGKIVVNDRVLFDSNSGIDLKPQERNVSYMFQNYAIFPNMTVEENIMAGLKGSKEENYGETERILSKFNIEGLKSRYPGELSGGQQQRVALARIMVRRPELILLDEPFSALDLYIRDKLQREIMEMIDDYDKQVIMVSHSRDEIYRFSQEIFVLEEGRVLKSGRTKAVFADPERVEVARLTGCKNIVGARRLGRRTLEIPSWGVKMEMSRDIPEDISAAGYRAHYFTPIWGEAEAEAIPFRLMRRDELPFEDSYYILPAEGDGESPICWLVQGEMKKRLKERGLPDYLKLDEDAIMLLKD